MRMMLCRPPTDYEERLQYLVRNMPPSWIHGGFPDSLWQGLSSPDPIFAAALSLIELPPDSRSGKALGHALLASPDFLVYITDPTNFSREHLLAICRGLMLLEPRLDALLVSTLFEDNGADPDQSRVLHVLSVLDDLSPGGRLAMPLTRLTRESSPPVASKAALMFGRRVANPAWVERQMEAKDARMRANVIEGLWGTNTPAARVCLRAALHDANNRVIGNALVGLYILGEKDVRGRLAEMARHPSAPFRATAVWAMGRTKDRGFMELLSQALLDPDSRVRGMAERVIAAFPGEIVANAPASRSAALGMEPETDTDAQADIDTPAGQDEEWRSAPVQRTVYRRTYWSSR